MGEEPFGNEVKRPEYLSSHSDFIIQTSDITQPPHVFTSGMEEE